jgi:outer membrane receptor for ferrienterochelin and colicins
MRIPTNATTEKPPTRFKRHAGSSLITHTPMPSRSRNHSRNRSRSCTTIYAALALLSAHALAQSAPETPKPPAESPPAEEKSAPPRPAPNRPNSPNRPNAPTQPSQTAPAAGQKPQELQKIEVTGKQDATTLRRESSATKIIITREDIEQYGDTNLGDVMRRLPGVTQGGRPGRGGPIQMRGMGGGFTQILINGERIAPGFSPEQISPDQVERIEILRAPTAETGARAIAGTINIILREPLRVTNNDIRGGVQVERGKVSPGISLTRNDTLGPTGTYNLSINIGQFDQLNSSVSQTTYLNTLTNAVELDHREASESRDKRESAFVSGRLQWRLGPGEIFSIQPFLVANNIESNGRTTREQTGGTTQIPYATSTTHSETEVRVLRLMTMLNRRIDDATRYEIRGSAGLVTPKNQSVTNQFNASGVRTLVQTNDSDTRDESWNLTGKITRSWGDAKHSLVGGIELENVRRNETSTTLLNGVRQLADFGAESNVSTRRTAFYIQDEWDPSPQFGTYAGLRWEEIKTKSATASNPVANTSRVLTPLAQGVWRLAAPKRDQIRLALTQSYRAPTTQNLVARPSLNTLFPVPGANTPASPDRAGNPNLKPEIANGIDLAYENYLKAGGVVSVNFFNRQIKDLIRNVTALESVTYASVPRYVSRPQNLGKARTSGIEFDAKFQLTELIEGAVPINFKVNASIFDSDVKQVRGPNNRIDEQPRATGNFGADYRFRGTPFTVGGNLGYTPAYSTQQTNDQFRKLSTKRVLEAYGLWSINSQTRLRLTLANIAPRDLDTTNVIELGNQRQTVLNDARTDMSVSLRFEMRL